ncbi:hypothetical protein BKA70DRAFT_1232476 [Coprinopsis sp. MPI-PUGE-AT-0042]|nr:hypothetical protein BKA70DRAFT_1232476 [Coprinopsis sp. MPI-PUGE-AT-0042]
MLLIESNSPEIALCGKPDGPPGSLGATSLMVPPHPPLLSPLPIGLSGGLYYSYDVLEGSSTSHHTSNNPHKMTAAEIAFYQMYNTPSPGKEPFRLPGPVVKRPFPHSEDENGKGKRRRTCSESLDSMLRAAEPSEIPFGLLDDTSSIGFRSTSSANAESEPRHLSRSATVATQICLRKCPALHPILDMVPAETITFALLVWNLTLHPLSAVAANSNLFWQIVCKEFPMWLKSPWMEFPNMVKSSRPQQLHLWVVSPPLRQ